MNTVKNSDEQIQYRLITDSIDSGGLTRMIMHGILLSIIPEIGDSK